MNVSVTHNSTDISNHVIQYEREHKICTGIGMLDLEVENNYSGSFDPWDVITIYENGKKSGQYYVSSASEGQPNSTITISAQDNSKRLSDYFISDSYVVDYPSYNKFWISHFLQEVGISYTFLTDEPGALLSNNTSLGLMTAYEQIMMLVQMSGWYFTFDYNGKMLIGKSSSSFGSRKGTYNNKKIIKIETIKSDRMLRNRVVVWGKGDPESERWIFADVSKRTKWDYDSKDKRTIVISNSNIRKTKDAFALANRALLEFANITVEKHLTIEGAENLVVGDIVGVRNLTYTGAGKVTTFGTSMSNQGLVTNIILDERCPRLFGFFDIGGFVYVGTFGSGVWRKSILPLAWSGGGSGLLGFASGLFALSGWFNYSSGLMDNNVTDLHVNASVLASVTSSGQAYTSLEDETPWIPVDFQGLTVSVSGILVASSGGVVDSATYSGLMARACIIDRDTNNAHFVVDTRSGINYGDFLMETDPLGSHYYEMFSYVVPSATYLSGLQLASGINPNSFRSWVVEASAYSGIILETFPINISGDYRLLAYDIDNDGSNDYIEAMGIYSGQMPSVLQNGYYHGNRNSHINNAAESTLTTAYRGAYDQGTIINSLPYSGISYPITQSPASSILSLATLSNMDDVFYVEDSDGYTACMAASGDGVSNRKLFVATVDNTGASPVTTRYSKELSGYTTSSTKALSILRLSPFVFRFAFKRRAATLYNDLLLVDYDIASNSVTYRLSTGVFKTGSGSDGFFIKGPNCYHVFAEDGLIVWLGTISLMDGTSSYMKVADYPFIDDGTYTHNYSQQQVMLSPINDSYIAVVAFVYSRSDKVTHEAYFQVMRTVINDTGSTGTAVLLDYSHVFGTSFTGNALRITGTGEGRQLNTYSVLFEYSATGVGYTSVLFVDRGDSVINDITGSLASVEQPIFTLRNKIGQGIDSSFNLFDSGSLAGPVPLPVPAGYTYLGIVGIDSINGEFYMDSYSGANISANRRIIAVNSTGSLSRVFTKVNNLTRETVVGTFRITDSNVYWTKPAPVYGLFPHFMLLQRDNYDFNVVKSGFFRERVEISNYAPIVTMDRRISSLQTYYISQDGQVLSSTNPSVSGFTMSGIAQSGSLFNLGVVSDDFRYTSTEGATESGFGTNLYVVFSGQLGSEDLSSMSTMSGIFTTLSGSVTRVETSNFCLPDQYMFLSLSGYTGNVGSGTMVSGVASSGAWGFLQKDPISGVWVDYSSGYPQARTTIIRYDDII